MGPGPPGASWAVADKAGVHKPKTAANHEAPARVICESNARLKLMFRRIKCCVWPSVYAELLPFGGERVEEGVAVMRLVERLVVLPSQPEIQSEFGSHLKVILEKQGIGPGS